MKRIFLYTAISLLPAIACAQYTTGNKPQGAGDLPLSTTINVVPPVPCNIVRMEKTL